MREYISVIEILKGCDRYIDRIYYNGKWHEIDYSCPIGCTEVGGRNYLTFLCRKAKKEFKIYVEDSSKETKYFILRYE